MVHINTNSTTNIGIATNIKLALVRVTQPARRLPDPLKHPEPQARFRVWGV